MRLKSAFVVLFLVVIAGVLAQDDPNNLNILWGVNETDEESFFYSGDVIEVDFEINVSGPLFNDLKIEGEIDDQKSTIKLIDIFDYEDIDYEMSETNYKILDSTDVLNLVFKNAGKQQVNLLLSGTDDVVESFDMKIVGFESSGSYPKLPSIDIDGGDSEWKFLGFFEGYSGKFSKPEGLKDYGGSSVYIDDNELYYCEIINLSEGKDFMVYTNVANGSSYGNLEAYIFSYDELGDELTAYGGDASCGFTDIKSDFNYYNCSINLDYSLVGENLVCVHNTKSKSGSTVHYYLKKDSSSESGYTCVGDSGVFNCGKSLGDFFIKVKSGEYSTELKGIASIDDWIVGTKEYFIEKLNDAVSNCIPVDGGCLVVFDVESESAGIVSLQEMSLVYTAGSGEKTETNLFYSVETIPGYVTEVDGINLSDGIVITAGTESLFLLAPNVTKVKNYTLDLDLVSGPSDDVIIQIHPLVGVPEGDLQLLLTKVSGYLDLLNLEKSEYGDVLEAVGMGGKVNDAITTLNGYYAQAIALNTSNKTNEEIDSEVYNMSYDVLKLIKDLPESISIISEGSEVILVEPGDVTLDMVVQSEKNEDNRMQVYYEQNKFTVNAEAKYFEVEYFDNSKEKKSFVKKTLSGSGSGLVVFEVIPNSVVDSVSFKDGFVNVKKSPVSIYKKEFTSVSGVSFTYYADGNVVPALGELKTIIAPKMIAGYSGDIKPVCGDGVCTVLEIGGELVELEDSVTCPEDCAKKINWSSIIIVVLIGVLVIIAVSVYMKYFSRKKAVIKGENKKKSLFSSGDDERKLKEYVKNAIKNGMTRGKITSNLLKRGWKREQVDSIFKSLGGKTNTKVTSKINY